MKARFDASKIVSAYEQAFRRMRQLEGFSQVELLRAEAGVILKTWAGRTKVAKPDDALLRARYRAGKRAFGYTNIEKNEYGITVNTGRRGGYPGEVWYKHTLASRGKRRFQQAGLVLDTGAFQPAWIHWKASVWLNIRAGAERYGAELAKLLPHAAKSVGLARQSVIQIADALGIDLTQVKGGGSLSAAGIAKAYAAIASNGRSYRNGTGYQGGDERKFFIHLVNRHPYAVQIGMDQTLLAILSGRVSYIDRAYRSGVFTSVGRSTKAFPNLFKTSSPS